MPRGKRGRGGKRKGGANPRHANQYQTTRERLRAKANAKVTGFDWNNPPFNVERLHPQNPPVPETPYRLCVWFMVHNEEDHIERSLRSAASIADCFVVGDTGSTDNTVQQAIDVCKELEIPLYVIVLGEPQYPVPFPFFNFAAYRNRILTLAEQVGEWLLSLDASDEVRNGEYVPKILEQIPPNAATAMVQIRWGAVSHAFQRLLRASARLRYKDARHNYVELDQVVPLAQSVAAGDTAILIDDDGDNDVSKRWFDREYVRLSDKNKSEVRQIVSVDGNTLTLDKPVENDYAARSRVVKKAQEGDIRDAGFFLYQDRGSAKSSAKKYAQDAEYFQWRIDRGLSDQRIFHYLAQSLRDSALCIYDEAQLVKNGNPSKYKALMREYSSTIHKAYKQYQRCAANTNQWREYIYISYFHCGEIAKDHLKLGFSVVEKHFMDAYNAIATPLAAMELHRLYRDEGRTENATMGPRCNQAQVWIMAACFIPNPKLALQDKPRDIEEKRWALLGSSSTFAGDASTAIQGYVRAQYGHLKHRTEWEVKDEEGKDPWYSSSLMWCWNTWGKQKPQLFASVPPEFMPEAVRDEFVEALGGKQSAEEAEEEQKKEEQAVEHAQEVVAATSNQKEQKDTTEPQEEEVKVEQEQEEVKVEQEQEQEAVVAASDQERNSEQ